jgi:predicted  nucleic acid-binding Zn-ribbon protein
MFKVTCIKCGKIMQENTPKDFTSICVDCATELADNMSMEDLIAHAKVGLDALIDERTGYQVKRPKGDLSNRLKQYKDGK